MKNSISFALVTLVLTLLLFVGASAGTQAVNSIDKHTDEYGLWSANIFIETNSISETDNDVASTKRSLCLFWGLIGNCGFQIETSFEKIEGNAPVKQEKRSEMETKSSQNSRSILWGAVQWSKKDKSIKPEENKNEDGDDD